MAFANIVCLFIRKAAFPNAQPGFPLDAHRAFGR